MKADRKISAFKKENGRGCVKTPRSIKNVHESALLCRSKGWLNLSRIEYLVDLGYAGGVEEPAKLFAWDYLSHSFGSNWWETRKDWIVAPSKRAREVIEREMAGVDSWTAPSLLERYRQLRTTSDRTPAH